MIYHYEIYPYYTGSQKRGEGGGGATPQIFAKVDFLSIENDTEKKKGAKKHKPYQIP